MWKLFAVPLVGAVIGYATNWIAVKMLFRPRHEVRLGGWKLPFTPGVIPKGQPRLARAVGDTVERDLLTAEVMKNMLLSEEMLERLRAAVRKWTEEQKASEVTIRETFLTTMDEESVDELRLFVQEKGSEYLSERLVEANVGGLLTQRILDVAKEKLAESMLGMMIGGSFLDSMAEMMAEKVNEYIAGEGKIYIESMIGDETGRFQNRTVGSVVTAVEENGCNLVNLVEVLYEKIVEDYLEGVMQSLHLSKVVEDRINSMEVEEVERLMLAIMKKELGAIVNLGALIGFILGLANVLILFL